MARGAKVVQTVNTVASAYGGESKPLPPINRGVARNGVGTRAFQKLMKKGLDSPCNPPSTFPETSIVWSVLSKCFYYFRIMMLLWPL